MRRPHGKIHPTNGATGASQLATPKALIPRLFTL
jgi:hypothetical protein